MRAALYIRVSTAEQANHGVSLEEQERLLRAQAEAKGWKAEAFVDAGLSGRKADNRPELQRLLGRLDEFDFVVVYKLDRLARSNVDLWRIVEQMQRARVELVSLSEAFDTSTPAGRLMLGLLSSVAEMESANTSQRVSMAAHARARQGRRMGGPRPFGYSQHHGELTLVPAEAEVLRRMRNEVLQGQSFRQIAVGLNRDGMRTARGAKWSDGRIAQMLANTLYVGMVHYKTEDFPGGHVAVFTPEEWDEVQAVLSARRSRPGGGRGRQPHLHLFTRGTLRCGCCGASIIPRHTTNAQGRVYSRYRCLGQVSGASPDCTMPSVSREAIDSAVLAYFHDVGLDLEATRQRIADNVEQAVAETRAALVHAERQRAMAEERVARVKADYVDGKIEAADWRELSGDLVAGRDAAAAEVERLAARVEEVAGQRALLDSEQELLEQLAELRRAVAGRVTDSTSVEGMRAALLRLFDGFTLHPFDEPEQAPALPEGWVRSALYTHPELMPAGVGLIVEPHPRREMILDDDKEIAFPQLRRVPLEARVRMPVSGR
jgi:site-specific DNA recombinase